jgi:hypothetical protein
MGYNVMNWQSVIKKALIGSACAVSLSVSAYAQNTAASATGDTTADAQSGACFSGPALLPQDTIASFLNNPSSLLQSAPVGGFQLTSQVRALAGSSNEAIPELVGLASSANDAQIAALGTGLAQAALACVANRPDVAALIQEEVAASNNQALITAFTAASGNVETAAITGSIGGVGGVTGGGAPGIGTGGTVGGTGGEGSVRSFSNPAFSLSAGNAGGGSVGTTVEVVSPTL